MKPYFLLLCATILISSCRDDARSNRKDIGIAAPRFENISKNESGCLNRSPSESIEINGITFYDCSISEDKSSVKMNFLERGSAIEFDIPRSGLSIQSIGFSSIQNISRIIENTEKNVDAINNAALVFGSGSKIKFASTRSFLIFFSDGGVVDDFIMVISCEDEKMVWFNPKVPLNGYGDEICHWLACRLSQNK